MKPKILFVCSMAKMRSRTANFIFSKKPYSDSFLTSYCGTDSDAEIPVTESLVNWADTIVCMEQCHKNKLRKKFKGISDKIVVLGIPDEYDYACPVLIARLEDRIQLFGSSIHVHLPGKVKQINIEGKLSYDN